MVRKTDVLIIGAGQAGLAMSRCLTAQGISHVVIDRGAIAQRWRAERWASLRLLTPNWMTRLPGWQYDGDDPNGYMHKDQVVAFLNRYARSFDAPIEEFTTVENVRQTVGGFRVRTSNGAWFARSVVVASGACDQPNVPNIAEKLSPKIAQITTNNYLHPRQIERAGVLVVGASATGVQLAEEIHRTGRPVTLAVGSHVRLPRAYRGRDTMAWMDSCGLLSEPRDPTIPVARALNQPSLQLVGDARGRDIGLRTLDALGVRCVGRLDGIDDTRAAVADTLQSEISRAEDRCLRTLRRIDDHIDATGVDAGPMEDLPAPLTPPSSPVREIDFSKENIRTIVWATGFRRSYPWLQIPVLDASGEIAQSGGVTAVPGLYTLGLQFMRRRNSTFIDGVGADARDISVKIAAHLDVAARQAA